MFQRDAKVYGDFCSLFGFLYALWWVTFNKKFWLRKNNYRVFKKQTEEGPLYIWLI